MSKPDRLTKISQSVIANQIALNFNHEIRYTGYYKKNLKRFLNLLEKELLKAEKEEFDAFYEEAEKPTIEMHKIQSEMIKEITDLGIHHFECITAMIKAYKKSPQSINGIVNKINKR